MRTYPDYTILPISSSQFLDRGVGRARVEKPSILDLSIIAIECRDVGDFGLFVLKLRFL